MKNFDNKYIGTFDTETEVLRKIDELKAEGYSEKDMYVMTSDRDQISMVRGRTDVDVDVQSSGTGGGWMDKFMGFLSGEEPTRGAFDRMGVDSGEADRYHNEVKNGKILLYVDRDYGTHYESEGYVDDAAVASPGLTVDTNASNDAAYNTNRNLVENDDRLDTGRIDSGVRDTDEVIVGEERPVTGTDRVADVDLDRDRVAETDEERLRLHEERLNVGKETVQKGEVNVGKHTVEERQHVEVPVEREEVVVERRPVNEETTAGINDRAYDENEEIHIPLKEEKVEVSKKDVVAEEIVVGKRKVQDTEVIDETVRHEEADIEGDVEIDEAERLRREREDKGRL